MNCSLLSKILFIPIFLNLAIFTLPQKFDVMLSQTLKYPREAREQKIEEIVYVSLDIDEVGKMRSFEILQSPNPILYKEVVRSFDLIQKTWKKQLLEEKKFNQKYLVVLEFNLARDYSLVHNLFKQANDAMSVKNQELALSLLDQCISLNPYNEIYFSTRSNLFREMGNLEASQQDFLRARKLKNELLSHIIITGYSL